MTKTPARDWNTISWPQVSVGDAARWIAVLPLAATEQHGPHLPLETDVMIGEAYLAKLRELLPPALPVSFLPMQKIGISTEHTDFPGTLTLSPETAIKSWMALGESVARTGLKKLVMVTSHGGNSAAMSLVAQELRTHHRMLVVPCHSLAGDLVAWIFNGLADLPFRATEFLLHMPSDRLITATLLQVRVVRQLTKFLFHRPRNLLAFAFQFIFVSH